MITRSGRKASEKIPFSDKFQIFFAFQTRIGLWATQNIKSFQHFLLADSVAAGKRFDQRRSKTLIRGFVKDYGIDASEAELPLSEYPTLNRFFARRLKRGARPIDRPRDDSALCSPCDCRISVFESVEAATKLWIKGNEFSVEALLGPRVFRRYGQDFKSGATVAVCRLAPTDYHRFHFPARCTYQTVDVDAKNQIIGSDLSLVKPFAVNSPTINPLTRNRRLVVPMSTSRVGTFMFVIVGATRVGSIVISAPTRASGKNAAVKGMELGYFQYGGSSVVLIFRKGAIQFDRDLIQNSKNGFETLVRMGVSLGAAPENKKLAGDPE